MTGRELHNRLKTIRINGEPIELKKLANDMGISPQSLNNKFLTADIGIGFAQKICEALSISFDLLINKNTSTVSEPETTYSLTNYKEVYERCNQQRERLVDELLDAKDEIKNLKKELETLKNK